MHPDDPAILEEYCDFLKEYLSQGFAEKQMEQIQRNQYTQLLLKQLDQKGEPSHLCLPDGKSSGAKGFCPGRKSIEDHGSELAQKRRILDLENSVSGRKKNGKRTGTEFTGAEGRTHLSFFQRKGGTGILAGLFKRVKAFQFKGILVILGCFLLMGAILFAERSGLSYRERNKGIDISGCG